MASMQACMQKNPPAIFLIEKDLRLTAVCLFMSFMRSMHGSDIGGQQLEILRMSSLLIS